MPKNVIWYCYIALCWLFRKSRQAAAMAWKLSKFVWYTVFVMSWCLVELIWLLVLIGMWIGLKIYCCKLITRFLSSPAITGDIIRCPCRITTTPADVSLPVTRDIPGVSEVTTSSSTAANTAVVTPVTTGTVTNTFGSNYPVTTAKVESNSRHPEVGQSTADSTTVDGKRCPRITTTPADVSLPDIPGVPGVTTSSTIAVSRPTAVVTSVTTNTVTTTNVESNCLPPEVCRNTAESTLNGNAVDESCTAKCGFSTSELLFSSPSSPSHPSQELTSMHDASLSNWSSDLCQPVDAKDKPKATTTNTSIAHEHANAEAEYETDFTESGVVADSNAEDSDEVDVARLTRLLEAQPGIYKRCKMDIKLANLAHAVVCDDESQKIVIRGRRQFGRALHGDEIVVQIMSEENRFSYNAACTQDYAKSLLESDTEDSGGCIFGRVDGILKRASNLINRTFICRPDDNHHGNMIPFDIHIPIIKIEFCEEHSSTQRTDVVCMSTNKQLSTSCRSQRFKVKVVRWEKRKINPLGNVVAVVKTAVETKIDSLEKKYGVQKSFSEDALEQAKKVSEKVKSGKLRHKVEEDYRKKLVFTIDEQQANVLDDALSVERLDDGYLFGIHIADVSAQVPQDSPIDKEARKRGVVFKPIGREHWPMLPETLSEVCSLLPEEDRPTVSVFVTTDRDYKIQEDSVMIKRCQIRSKRQLTYEEAEELIAQEDREDESDDESYDESDDLDHLTHLSWSIHRLKEAAICWRRERLGNDKCYRPPKLMSMNCITARTLVEEMMITANFQVARILVRSVPCKSPLRHKLHRNLQNRSVDLNDDDDDDDKTIDISVYGCSDCNVDGECLTTSSDHVQLSRSMPIALLSAVLESFNLNQQNACAKYICSGKAPTENWQHCGLKLPQYTHFTSPIRRYIDIVVHRILLSVIDAEQNKTEAERYTREGIAKICEECNVARLKARSLKYDSCSIRLCSLLRERSVVVYAVVYKITESEVVLLFPNLQSVFSTSNSVKFSSLKPSVLPKRTAERVTLQWQQRIYDHDYKSVNKEKRSTNCGVVKLYPQVVHIKPTDWEICFRAVTAEEDKDVITKAIDALCAKDDLIKNRVRNLTSEGNILQCGKHFCDYAAIFSKTCIVKVQLAAKNLVKPHIQLFHLTPLMCICVEHNTGAVECFSKPATKKAVVSEYNDIGHYQNLWLPVLAAEAAYSAVANGHSIIVHNVDIHWTEHSFKTTGTFEIDTKFCKERNITFPVDEAMHDSDAKGYMCVRYADSLKQVVKKESAVDTFKGVIDVDKPFTWVGHCVVTRVSLDKTYYVIHLLLKQNTCSLPKQLLELGLNKATIEWIPKLVPDR